jgi:hypothetical protein
VSAAVAGSDASARAPRYRSLSLGGSLEATFDRRADGSTLVVSRERSKTIRRASPIACSSGPSVRPSARSSPSASAAATGGG